MSKKIKRLDGDNWKNDFIKVYEDDELKFHESDVKECVFTCEIERIEHDERRWTRLIESIISIKDRYFSIFWERGLTESQPNIFDHQPTEVEKVEKKVVVTEWASIEE